MVRLEDLKKDWYKPGEIGKLIGVTSRTILTYREKGMFEMRLDEETNRWYASRSEVANLLRAKGMLYEEDKSRSVVLYARVSSHDQKKNGDLQRQVVTLVDACIKDSVLSYVAYTDVGSGLNANRPGLGKVLDLVMSGKVGKVYITYKDRLTRFGYEYLEKLFRYFGVEIVVLHEDVDKAEQEELVDDMMSLLASFSGKLYGMRSSRRKKVQELLDDVPEIVEES